jgi:hypothetical protein
MPMGTIDYVQLSFFDDVIWVKEWHENLLPMF